MSVSYLKYYDRYSPMAPFHFWWDSLRAQNKIRAISLMHRQGDYMKLADDPSLLAFHRRLNGILWEASQRWDSYDYGEGYFYQGCAPAGITGLRDTQTRVRQMDLAQTLKGLRVLEIGCNTGFLTAALAPHCAWVEGFDINPYAIQIGREVLTHLGAANCRLSVATFEAFEAGEAYDTVLSFANHHTYDGNSRETLREYFERCARMLKSNGQLLFESHPPAYEKDGLKDVLAVMDEFFVTTDRRILTEGTFLDRGRTYVTASKRER